MGVWDERLRLRLLYKKGSRVGGSAFMWLTLAGGCLGVSPGRICWADLGGLVCDHVKVLREVSL